MILSEVSLNCPGNVFRRVDLPRTRLTDILRVSCFCHLPRFDIQGTVKRKLRTDIHYPLTNLDLTPYICPVFRKHPMYNLCAVVVSSMLMLSY